MLPTVDAAKTVAMLLVNVTALAPLFDKVIAPVKLLDAPLVVKLIVFAPAVKLAVPGTTIAPVCEIAPPASTIKLPLFVKGQCWERNRRIIKGHG